MNSVYNILFKRWACVSILFALFSLIVTNIVTYPYLSSFNELSVDNANPVNIDPIKPCREIICTKYCSSVRIPRKRRPGLVMLENIYDILPRVKWKFGLLHPNVKGLIKNISNALKNKINSLEIPWSLPELWVKENALFTLADEGLGSVLGAMKTFPIVGVRDFYEGTQLKLSLTLDGNQTVIFKPRRPWAPTSSNSEIFSGSDKHEGEIIGFLLSLLLNLHIVPPTVERKISIIRDIFPYASKALARTIFLKEKSSCLYGLCYYCKKSNPVCDNGHYLYGSAQLWLPKQLSVMHNSHPWARTYNKNKLAQWEMDPHFCHKFKPSFFDDDTRTELLLNLIDISIFDFLIQNGDRHHFLTAVLQRSSQISNKFDNDNKNFRSPAEKVKITSQNVGTSQKSVRFSSKTSSQNVKISRKTTKFSSTSGEASAQSYYSIISSKSKIKNLVKHKANPSSTPLSEKKTISSSAKTETASSEFDLPYFTPTEVSSLSSVPFVLALDNGKSFKNAFVDHADILAPLFQCCRIRRTTYNRLLLLKGGGLSRALKQFLRDIGSPLLVSEDHLEAIDRRLVFILAAIQSCLDSKEMIWL